MGVSINLSSFLSPVSHKLTNHFNKSQLSSESFLVFAGSIFIVEEFMSVSGFTEDGEAATTLQ